MVRNEQDGPYRRNGWAKALIVLATLGVALVLIQGLLAGLFVTGDVGLLSVHSMVANALSAVLATCLVVAIVYRRVSAPASHRPAWRILTLAVVINVLIGLQGFLGAMRVVAPHIFLGVASTVFSTAFVVVVALDTRPNDWRSRTEPPDTRPRLSVQPVEEGAE